MKHWGILLSLLLLEICSCGNRTYQYFDPEEVNNNIRVIDSLNNAIIAITGGGATNVIDPVTDQKYSDEEVYSSWKEDELNWNKFVSLCYKQKYKKACSMLLNDEFHGNALGHIRTSDLRYFFIKQVADPLILEIESDMDVIIDQYVKWRKDEFTIESALLRESEEPESIIPEHYVDLLRELGFGYAKTGRIDKAVDLAYVLKTIVSVQNGDNLMAELVSYQYLSQVYTLAGDVDSANEYIGYFRDSILPNYEPIGSDNYNEICSSLDDLVISNQ